MLPDVASGGGEGAGRARRCPGATEGASLPPGLTVPDVDALGTRPVFVPCTPAGPPASPRVTLGAGEIITCLSGRREREGWGGQETAPLRRCQPRQLAPEAGNAQGPREGILLPLLTR